MTTIKEVTNANLSAISLNLVTPLAVAQGGTGVNTIASGSVVVGAGTSAITTLAPGAGGNVATNVGSVWTSAAPAGSGPITLLHSNNGVSGVSDSVVISGLTAKDRLWVYYAMNGAASLIDSSSNAIDIDESQGGYYANQTWINQMPGTGTTIMALSMPSASATQTYTDSASDTYQIPSPCNFITINTTFGTWTGTWTLTLSGNSAQWLWSVFKVAGQ